MQALDGLCIAPGNAHRKRHAWLKQSWPLDKISIEISFIRIILLQIGHHNNIWCLGNLLLVTYIQTHSWH